MGEENTNNPAGRAMTRFATGLRNLRGQPTNGVFIPEASSRPTISETIIHEGNTGTNIPADIEEGIEHIIAVDIAETIDLGLPNLIPGDVRRIAEGIELSAQALQTKIELPPKTRELLRQRVNQVISAHLNTGLSRVIELTAYNTSICMPSAISNGPSQINALFQLADELGSEINYFPIQQTEHPSELPTKALNTQDGVLHYLDEVINNNMLKGVASEIGQIAYQVRSGSMTEEKIVQMREELDHWLEIMKQRGFQIVDEPFEIIESEQSEGLIVRKVNKREIDARIDEAIKTNLAAGVEAIIASAGYRIRNGHTDPLSPGNLSEIPYYVSTAEKLGLSDISLNTVREDSKINPNLIQEAIRQAARENLDEGIRSLAESFMGFVHAGKAQMVVYELENYKFYLDLAEELGVPTAGYISSVELANSVKPSDVQAGINSLLTELKDDIRGGKFGNLNLDSLTISQFQSFVREYGLEKEVDFSEILNYMNQNGVGLIQLPSRSS